MNRVKSTDIPTIRQKRSLVVLVVGFGPDFVGRCEKAAAGTELKVVAVEAGGESAFAMQTLPLAVVMQRDTIRTSPLASIARELGIGLLAVPGEEVTDARLKELFDGALAAGQARSRRGAR